MRKTIRGACALLLALALAGCAGMAEPLHGKASTEPAAVAQTRAAIDEGYALVISLNRVIVQNANAGVWTREQALGYVDRSEAARAELDRARELLRLGDLTGATNQAELVRSAITALQREIAAAARKGG